MKNIKIQLYRWNNIRTTADIQSWPSVENDCNSLEKEIFDKILIPNCGSQLRPFSISVDSTVVTEAKAGA